MSESPFDFLNSINQTKVNLIRDEGRSQSEYVPYLTNRGLSYFADTIMLANEMNVRPSMDKQMQYEFLLHSARPRKRMSKWAKKDDAELIQKICDIFQCSTKKAEEMRDILGIKRLSEIVKIYEKSLGGIQNAK